MGVIYSTVLATSQPLGICTGFPMFPKGAGPYLPQDTRSAIQKNFTILDIDTRLPILNFIIVGVDLHIKFVVANCFYMGFCGPAVALSTTVGGQTYDSGTAVGLLSNTRAQAGFALAAVNTFAITIGVGLEVWYDVFVASGNFEIFGFEFTLPITFDLLNLAIQVIAYGVKRKTKERTGKMAPALPGKGHTPPTALAIQAINPPPPNFFPNIPECGGELDGTVWGFYDESEDGYTNEMDAGKLTLNPALTVTFNIAPFIDGLKNVEQSVKQVGGELVCGPQVTITFPTTLEVHKLLADTGTYDRKDTNLSTDPGNYTQLLAETAIAAYQTRQWVIPALPDLLALAAQTVNLGSFPDTTAYFRNLIVGAGGTVPTAPNDGLNGNQIGFVNGPAQAAYAITTVGMQFKQTVGLTVTLGWTIQLDVLGLSIGATLDIPINLTEAFGVVLAESINQFSNSNGGQFVTSQADEPGQTVASAQFEETRREIERQFVDVVFETVGA